MITRKAGPALAAGCTMVLKFPPVRRRVLQVGAGVSWRFARAPAACQRGHAGSAESNPPNSLVSCRLLSGPKLAAASVNGTVREKTSKVRRWSWAATVLIVLTMPTDKAVKVLSRNSATPGKTAYLCQPFIHADGVYDRCLKNCSRW